MLSLKKFQQFVVLLSLVFLSLVTQTGLSKIPSPASNSYISDMSSTRNMSTEEVVGS